MSDTRTIRITVQLTLDETQSGSFQPVENPVALGEIAKAWWMAQKKVTSCTPPDCQHTIWCHEAEMIGIEEPKAHRFSSAFRKALEKKRERVKEILYGQS